MLRSRVLLTFCVGLLFVSSASRAAEANVTISATEILGFGLFEVSSASRHAGFTRNTVAADAVRGVHFKEFTDRVPMILHTNFGFQYSINSTPHGQKLPVRSIIRFPEPGLRQPGGKLYKKSVENKHVRLGKADLHGFGFDEPWEMVPGEWVFEIWHGDAMLIRKTFMVEEPDFGNLEEATQITATDGD